MGRNGFNKEGDREEGHVQVNFVKGKSQYDQKTERGYGQTGSETYLPAVSLFFELKT